MTHSFDIRNGFAALRFAVLGSSFGIFLGLEHADTAMRDSAIHPREASLRSLSASKDNRFMPIYEFADEDEIKITHLDPFAAGFLKKCDLGRTISRYMVLLAGEQKLMIMPPYQVYAVQHMAKCIDDDDVNGFVWHTTGSGKTLTSFKASTFATLSDTLLPKLLSRELSVTETH